uniref:Uncharacterized protein n=1 Tax=Tanacetum cinerariifolium TaxID=118510 RepID=A0A6L2MSQ6_TANCI|nr:hypothetical protein [Tanacetum cinerariifolium]
MMPSWQSTLKHIQSKAQIKFDDGNEKINAVLTKSKLVLITVARPFTASVLKPHVPRPRQAKTIVTTPHSPPRRTINRSPSPKTNNFPPKVTAAKAPMVNAVKGNWDKGVINSRCSRHMIGNMSNLSDFEELNGRYVAFGGNPKGGKISGKGSGPTWLFDIDTLTKTMNYQPVTAGNQSNPSTKNHDDKTKREAKGKNPVESST